MKKDDIKNSQTISNVSGSSASTHNAWNVGGNKSSHINRAGSEISGQTSTSHPQEPKKDRTGLK